ncbi:oxidoreductase [Geothrix sp. 21YS21S-4]|uniref:oxidoreductase n=1 Tax=Geothrix sp. 21YS21S-4 TaxID=3068889 RepID=UPI0027B98523|nr:oxidoreductase [Geothrix sp. 21YS21S-4]
MPTLQRPVDSGFGATTTAEDLVQGLDLSGKTVLVTGGYSGIGLETTRVLSGAGATVVVPARTPAKARENLAGLSRVELGELDLQDPASIDAFAAGFLATGRPLDLLILSAGVMAAPLLWDGRGYESQFSTNHLGHFQLTLRLMPALVRAGGARVVVLSSRGHRYSAVDFEDPHFERRAYERWQGYGQSKTANALFALGLDRRTAERGVRAFSVHPGGILTDLVRHLTDEDLDRFNFMRRADGKVVPDPAKPAFPLKTVGQGAATTVWCATSPKLAGLGGVYCEDCEIAEVVPGDVSTPTGVAPWACDPDAAERLWALSERLTGARLDL